MERPTIEYWLSIAANIAASILLAIFVPVKLVIGLVMAVQFLNGCAWLSTPGKGFMYESKYSIIHHLWRWQSHFVWIGLLICAVSTALFSLESSGRIFAIAVAHFCGWAILRVGHGSVFHHRKNVA
jgi:hypothetical protein